ncbi:hypothetical protein RFI_08304, partial [Reticulomyxa filosa]
MHCINSFESNVDHLNINANVTALWIRPVVIFNTSVDTLFIPLHFLIFFENNDFPLTEKHINESTTVESTCSFNEQLQLKRKRPLQSQSPLQPQPYPVFRKIDPIKNSPSNAFPLRGDASDREQAIKSSIYSNDIDFGVLTRLREKQIRPIKFYNGEEYPLVIANMHFLQSNNRSFHSHNSLLLTPLFHH